MLHCRFPGALLFTCRDGRDQALLEIEDRTYIADGPCCATEPDVVVEYPTFDEAAHEFLAHTRPRELATTP